MITITRTDSNNPDFAKLTQLLDIGLAEIDGDSHSFYSQFNKIDQMKQVLIAYQDKTPIACGAIKPFDKDSMEIKRMFTLPESRGFGVASMVLKELEQWAEELGYKKCILETGHKHTLAVALYHKNKYQIIPNYGQYQGLSESICFMKELPNR